MAADDGLTAVFRVIDCEGTQANLALAPAQAVTTYALEQILQLRLACMSFVASGAVVLARAFDLQRCGLVETVLCCHAQTLLRIGTLPTRLDGPHAVVVFTAAALDVAKKRRSDTCAAVAHITLANHSADAQPPPQCIRTQRCNAG